MLAVAAIGAALAEPGARSTYAMFFLLAAMLVLLPLRLALWLPMRGGAFWKFAAASAGCWAVLAIFGRFPALRANASPATWSLLCAVSLACLPAIWTKRPGAASAITWPWAAACAALTLYCASALWCPGKGMPSSESALVGSAFHVDTLVYAATTALMRDFGHLTAGLDGLAPLRWHFMTQTIFAAVSKLTGASGLMVDVIFYPLFAPAFLCLGMVLLTFRLNEKLEPADVPAAAGICLALAVWVLPLRVLGLMATWDPITSEPYGLALGLLLVGLAGLPDSDPPPLAAEALFLSLWIAELTLCKVSVGFVAAPYAALRLWRRARTWPVRLSLSLIPLAACGILLPFVITSLGAHYALLYFPQSYAAWGFKKLNFPMFMAVHWLPIWLGLAAWEFKRRPSGLAAELLTLWREDRFAVGFLLPAAAIGFASMSITIFAGSGVYFSMTPAVASIPWAAAIAIDESWRHSQRSPIKRAAIAVMLVAALAQGAPRAAEAVSRMAARRYAPPPESVRAELQWLLTLRPRLRPGCGLIVDEAWLQNSSLARSVACWKVPYYFTGILERPLYASWMPQECRESAFGKGYHHAAGPKSVGLAHACRDLKSDGLSCADLLTFNGAEPIDCP